MKRHVFRPATLIASLALCSCGGGGAGGGSAGSGSTPTLSLPTPIVKSYTFAPGSATASPGNTAWDIVGVRTTLSQQFGGGGGNLYDTLRVDVTFTQDVSHALPAPGQQLSGTGAQLGVHIALDTDDNVHTGEIKGCNQQSALVPFEYITDQGNEPSRLADGNYSIIGPEGGPISSGGNNAPSEAVTSVSGHVLTQSFFLPAIDVAGGASIPVIGVAVSALNGADDSATDCVPHGGVVQLDT